MARMWRHRDGSRIDSAASIGQTSAMEIDVQTALLLAAGMILLWLVFRRRTPSRRGWITLLAMAIAAAIGFTAAFNLMPGFG